jgi:hypothetical protein
MFKAIVKAVWVVALGALVVLGQLAQPLQAQLVAAKPVATHCGCGDRCNCCLKPGDPAPATPPLAAAPASGSPELAWALILVASAGLPPGTADPASICSTYRAVPAAPKVAIFQRDCSWLI